MHLLFLDESGRLEQDGLFGLGGIAVLDTDWQRLRDLWHETLREHNWPLDLELKVARDPHRQGGAGTRPTL